MAARDRRLRRLHDELVQAEIRLARDIQRQHPDVTRSDALRVAAKLLARDPFAPR
jgi:hypothetical protein